MDADRGTPDPFDFIDPSSRMAGAIQSTRWEGTVLGPVAAWPQSLRSALSICLGSSFPIAIYWGPDLGLLYNDDWSPILGSKHPWGLGRPAAQVWPEIWDTIAPLFERVMTTGQATRSRDQLLAMHRHGFMEECYFDYTFSPIRGEGGKVGGIFNAVVETTFRVIGERRTQLLTVLGERVAGASHRAAAWQWAMEVLRQDPHDLPFAILYMADPHRPEVLRRVATTEPGLPADLAPEAVLLGEGGGGWPLAEVMTWAAAVVSGIGGPSEAGIVLPPWPEACTQCLLLPILGLEKQPAGVLVAGISPRLALDTEYRAFLERIAATIASATARAQTIEQARERAEALAQLDRAKTAFFSNVSHELRTPLTLLLGPLTDVLGTEALPPALRTPLMMAERNALRLSNLVNTLLEFSRLEAGQQQPACRPTDLGQLTADVAGRFRFAMQRAGLDFEVSCAPGLAPVSVDPDMWERIVLNLLSNALKFTFAGKVSVELGVEGTAAVLVVRDTGVGVPAAAVPRLFERFYRAEGTQGRTHEGSGIGLALVQELIRLHGGSVSARSEVGHGTTFTVRLPLDREPPAASHVDPACEPWKASRARQSDAQVQEALRWLPEAGVAAPAWGMGADGGRARIDEPRRGTWGARVVVADDNADMRQYLMGLLQPNYQVETVGDGEQALQAIRRHRPAVLLADVMMPRLDGFQLLAAVRADPQLRTLPVILVSARAGEEARVEGLDAGADDYLVKPFPSRELLARVAAVIELDRVRRLGEQQIRLAMASAKMFTWGMDLQTDKVTTSDNAVEILGMSMSDLRTGLSTLHPEDRVRHREIVEAAVRRRDQYTDEVRIVRPDGSVRWLEVRARVICNEDGEARQLAGISFDVTQRKQLEHALRQAGQQKEEFLAMLAHELRNPLAPIRSAADVMLRLAPADERLRKAAAIVDRQVMQLTRMVDDLLDVSRITRGRIELARQPMDLSTIVNPALDTVEALVRDKGHRVTVALPGETLYVDGDAIRLQQCLVNLLANAAKYTGPGGSLRIGLHQDGPDAVLTVTDNGVGIAGDVLPAVFELFVQSDRSLDRSEGGLGIGLSVVKSLVELHGGKVSARSAGDGLGSAFEIRLPLVSGRPAPVFQQAPPAGAARRVLVVDDNRDAAEMIGMVLQLAGHDVRPAFDAHEALAVAADWKPHVVLLDIGLPGLDGYETAGRLRKLPGLQHMLLVALTGYGQPQDRQQALAAGFDQHLMKPASEPDLLRMIADAPDGSSW